MSAAARRALFLAGKVRLGSSCLYMLELAKGLNRAGCETMLLCSSLEGQDEARRAGVMFRVWNELHRPWPLLLLGATMRRQLAEWGIQLVHIHGQRPGVFGRRLIAAARLPMVFTPEPLEFRPPEAGALHVFAQRVIVMDQGVREDCVNQARIPRDKIALIRQGIDLEGMPASPPLLGERKAVVGAAGPLARGKGQDAFLRSARLLADSGRRAEFVIAGDGPQERPLRKLCRELDLEGVVTFVTRLRQYQAVLQTLDVFVRPSLTYGLGFTLLKAMAMGKAVVATDVGGAYRLVEDQVTGRLVGKGRPEALAEAVGDLLDHPGRAEHFGRRAREFVRLQYGLDQAVEKTLATYAEALEAFNSRRAYS